MPLNPGLYEVLRAHAPRGFCNIQNMNAKYRYHLKEDSFGNRAFTRICSGEEYSICCPLCGDKKFRLNVSYLFGSEAEGLFLGHLAHCWNEECEVIPLINKWLDGTVIEPLQLERVEREPTTDEVAAVNAMEIPQQDYCPLTSLRADHPCIQYLQGRGFDPVFVQQWYGAGYVADSMFRFARKRLFIPVWYKGMMIGWQTRRIDGFSYKQEPKYWTCSKFSRGHFLYNWDMAEGWNGMILVEGPTDTWRVGGPCCAILGRNLTPMQARLIATRFAYTDGPVVLIADPGFEKDWQKNRLLLAQEMGSDRRLILLTPETDPGSTDPALTWSVLTHECDRRGIKRLAPGG